MLPELIFGALVFGFGLLIFIFDKAYGRFSYRAALIPLPEKAYPFLSRIGGALAVLVGIGFILHCAWVWVRTLIFR